MSGRTCRPLSAGLMVMSCGMMRYSLVLLWGTENWTAIESLSDQYFVCEFQFDQLATLLFFLFSLPRRVLQGLCGNGNGYLGVFGIIGRNVDFHFVSFFAIIP